MAVRRRLAPRSRRLLALAWALAALVIQTGGTVAAPGSSWTVTASPQTIVAGSSSTVRLTIKNTSTASSGTGIGCVKVTIPATFTVGNPTIVSVSNGRHWSATRSGHTVTAKGISNGVGCVRLPTTTRSSSMSRLPWSIALGPWTFAAYEQTDCKKGTFAPQSILITMTSSARRLPSPAPSPAPTPAPTPAPNPGADGHARANPPDPRPRPRRPRLRRRPAPRRTHRHRPVDPTARPTAEATPGRGERDAGDPSRQAPISPSSSVLAVASPCPSVDASFLARLARSG